MSWQLPLHTCRRAVEQSSEIDLFFSIWFWNIYFQETYKPGVRAEYEVQHKANQVICGQQPGPAVIPAVGHTSKRACTTDLCFKALRNWLLKYYDLLFGRCVQLACRPRNLGESTEKGSHGSEKNYNSCGSLHSLPHTPKIQMESSKKSLR